MAEERLTARQFQDAGGVEDWRVLALGASAWFEAPSQAVGAALVRRVADLAERAGGLGGLPDIDLRAGGVHIRIGAAGQPGFTAAEVAMARAVSTAARDLGLVPNPSAVQALQLAVDALDGPAVLPFWQAVLGYDRLGADDLLDPLRRQPPLWFQQQDRPRSLRNRIHLDVARPRPLSRQGVEAVAPVGGHFVGESAILLADAEGNEADVLPEEELDGGSETSDWRVLFGAMTSYPVSAPAQAAELAAAAAGLADDAGFPLLVDLRPGRVVLDTGKDQWVDGRFPGLARRVQAAARGMGLAADPTPLTFVQFGIDAVDVPAVRSFWRAVLGYDDDPRPNLSDIYDPRRLGPPVIFQGMPASEEARRRQRNRIHVDLFVPDDQAQRRIETAVAAGGRVTYDEHAPAWWTIADPEGNEVDIAVSVGRAERWRASRTEGG